MRWRRDIRRFRESPVEAAVLDRCLCAFTLAPSVGLSEPWRVIDVTSKAARSAAIASFKAANTQALSGYCDEKANIYATLKLSGMQEAPIHLAVYCDESSPKGAGLGATTTMPEMKAYSVVGAITLFWLLARAEGLGVGWVSILDPVQLAKDLNNPNDWRLVGYLCVGWPETANNTPELERAGWEFRSPTPIRETH